jgi:hypothetical protein
MSFFHDVLALLQAHINEGSLSYTQTSEAMSQEFSIPSCFFQVFCHRNEKVINRKLVSRRWVIAMTIPDDWVQKPLELVCGKSLEVFGKVVKT